LLPEPAVGIQGCYASKVDYNPYAMPLSTFYATHRLVYGAIRSGTWGEGRPRGYPGLQRQAPQISRKPGSH